MNNKENILKKPISYVLGLQHLIAMFGATVLVPLLTGFNPTVAIFTAGLGTLIFHICTKFKVPVFLGSSFAFIPLINEVSKIHGGDLAYAQGGMMIAGLIYILFSIIVKWIGAEKIKKIFPPQVVGPMIMVIGFNLIPVAFDMSSNNYTISGVTLAAALIVNKFGKGFFRQLSILAGVIIGYLLALSLNAVDTSIISSAAIFEVPAFRFPKFSYESIMVIAPVAIAVFMEHVGDITTNGTVVGEDFIKDPGLNRTLLGDGLATIAATFLGGPANTTYGENTGVLAITKNYNPAIIRLTAVFAILLSFAGKLGGFLRSIPVPVMGGISLMLFSMIAYIGVRNITDNKVKFTTKNLIVMVFILFIGMAQNYIPNFSFSVKIPMTDVKFSSLSIAAAAGIAMNLILNVVFKKKG